MRTFLRVYILCLNTLDTSLILGDAVALLVKVQQIWTPREEKMQIHACVSVPLCTNTVYKRLKLSILFSQVEVSKKHAQIRCLKHHCSICRINTVSFNQASYERR